MADDALKCIETLLESVPEWIADVEAILKTASEKQEEILFANQPPTPETAAPRAPSKKSSLLSRRSKDSEKQRTPISKPVLPHLTNSDALRLSQKKRKTASVCSGDQSGPCKYRSKAVAVVYYDGDTQKRFEKLVRAVGSCRNAIRKGKMSAKVDNLSRTGSSGSEASGSSGGEDDHYSKITAGLKYRSSRTRAPTFGRNDGTEAFDKIDAKLEKAQSLCERAAHQILRDGDCTMEVTHAKEHFSEALRMADEELPALRKKAQKAAERRRRSEERREADEEAQAKLRAADQAFNQQVKDAVGAITFPSEGQLEVDDLEVDDSEEDGEFNITTTQFGKFAPHMRTTRLIAH